jgi:hypothetical protein
MLGEILADIRKIYQGDIRGEIRILSGILGGILRRILWGI